jgi:leucyl aminopeptidase (aminopeptidase T)
MNRILMFKGAQRILNVCAGLQPQEKVAIVTDFLKVTIAETLASAASAIGAEPVILIMPPREVDGQEPPEIVAEALKKADLILTPVSKSVTHTNAIREAVAQGSRGIMLSAFVEDQLISGGIDADFDAIKPLCEKVAQLLEKAKLAKLTTPAGTNLVMDLSNRKGNAHPGIARKASQITTIPNIESSTSPVEGKTEGILVGDASIPYYDIGLLREPVYMTVREGRIVDIKGGDQAQTIAQMMAAQEDPNVYNIAQLAFGLNPHCKMRGVMLDDEGVYGTSHIGIGTSTILGGKIKTKMHYDILMWKPTLELDSQVVLRDGEWLISP